MLLDREDSTLVVVDAQPGFLPGSDDVVANIVWLVAVAARLGIPVVVTEEEPERNGPTVERITAQLPRDTPIFTKPTFGLAGTPEIRAAIRGTAVLAGAETDVCVAQSAIGLHDAGGTCVVVADATFSLGDMHERGLARIAAAGIVCNHTKAVTYEWLRTVDAAHTLFADASLPPRPF